MQSDRRTETEANTEASRLKISSQVLKERVFVKEIEAKSQLQSFDLPFEECDLLFEEIDDRCQN